jgi:hypothetical protein
MYMTKAVQTVFFYLWKKNHFETKSFFALSFVQCRAEPDLEFEGLLKRQHTRVKYFQGSLMNAMDLERTKVNTRF